MVCKIKIEVMDRYLSSTPMRTNVQKANTLEIDDIKETNELILLISIIVLNI